MNAEMITLIVQQTAVVIVAIALLYGLQKPIKDLNDDQEGAIERARSLRRQAYRHSLEVLSGLNSEHISPVAYQSSQSVKGMPISRRSQVMHSDIQSSRSPLKHSAVEVSLKPAMLAANYKFGSRDQEPCGEKELLSC